MHLARQFLLISRYDHEENSLIDRMESLVRRFDLDLREVIDLKRETASRLKFAELRMILLYKELQVISSAQIQEDRLTRRAEELRETLADAEEKIKAKEEKLAAVAKVRSKYADNLKGQ